MSFKIKTKTLVGIAASLVIVPILLALQKGKSRKKGDAKTKEDIVPPNHIFAAYRGQYKPHHRKATQNGEA